MRLIDVFNQDELKQLDLYIPKISLDKNLTFSEQDFIEDHLHNQLLNEFDENYHLSDDGRVIENLLDKFVEYED